MFRQTMADQVESLQKTVASQEDELRILRARLDAAEREKGQLAEQTDRNATKLAAARKAIVAARGAAIEESALAAVAALDTAMSATAVDDDDDENDGTDAGAGDGESDDRSTDGVRRRTPRAASAHGSTGGGDDDGSGALLERGAATSSTALSADVSALSGRLRDERAQRVLWERRATDSLKFNKIFLIIAVGLCGAAALRQQVQRSLAMAPGADGAPPVPPPRVNYRTYR